MTPDEARKLRNGIYVLYWKDDGGRSLAAVGRLDNGIPWYAPINWVGTYPAQIATASWESVERVEMVLEQADLNAIHESELNEPPKPISTLMSQQGAEIVLTDKDQNVVTRIADVRMLKVMTDRAVDMLNHQEAPCVCRARKSLPDWKHSPERCDSPNGAVITPRSDDKLVKETALRFAWSHSSPNCDNNCDCYERAEASAKRQEAEKLRLGVPTPPWLTEIQKNCRGGCSRGGEGPACGKPGCY